MMTLYIDTSSSYLYTAIVKDLNIVCEIKKEFGQELSKEALPQIASMFELQNIKPKDINKIIVINGPGSFTGIRIGLTIAKVYAWSLNIPIITINALEAMSISSKQSTYHVPLIDARRGFVFGAIYDQNQEVVLKPQHIEFEHLKEKISSLDNYCIITNSEISEPVNKEKYDPDILKIVERFKDRMPTNPHGVNPEYLKLTEAEEKMQQ